MPVRCDSSHTVAPGRTVTVPTFSGCFNEANAVFGGDGAAFGYRKTLRCGSKIATPGRAPKKSIMKIV